MKNVPLKIFYYFAFSLGITFSTFFSESYSQTTDIKYHPNPIIGIVDGKPVFFEDIRN